MKKMSEILQKYFIEITDFDDETFQLSWFYLPFIRTLFVKKNLTETERWEIISQLLDRLGILTPPPIIFMYRYKGEFLSNTLEAVTWC